MIRIIINADDFGLTPGVNRAICEGFENGLITSTSALACSRFIEEGVGLLDNKYKANVGLHICLDEERPVSDPKKIQTLIDHKTGCFKTRAKLLRDLLLRRVCSGDMYVEMKAQFEKLRSLGIKIDHFDSHGHLHAFPQVSSVVDRLSKEYGVLLIRRPVESYWPALLTPANLRRLPISLLISCASIYSFKRRYETNSRNMSFMGLLDSGNVHEAVIQRWHKVVSNLHDRIIEVMCHPGVKDDKELDNYRHWKYQWHRESKALLHLRALLDNQPDIEMISFGRMK